VPDCRDESAACHQDRVDYDHAKDDRNTAAGQINIALTDHDNALAILAAGLSAMAAGYAFGIATFGVSLLVATGGGLATGYGAGLLIRANAALAKARQACEDARSRMRKAYDKSLTDCKHSDCRPPLDTSACP
jgi:hypothetical protein